MSFLNHKNDREHILPDVFTAVKHGVTARQVAEMYGIQVNSHGMACCPFHDDTHPSMKLDERYETHYNMTTVDPPELVRFVIRQFEAVIYDRRWSSSNLRFDLGHPRLRRGQLCQRQSCLADGSFKYFAVNSGGRLLSPATAQSVTGKRCIHFTIPKLSMRQLPPCAAPRPQAIPADPIGAVLL